ncbi:site-specific integrase [Polaromonas sp. LjRoot131]|uniref:site-specific integrase n=1 Tax=Polaromonas sp. LjRoot131 TaxID=3342262 RepID=UPI003ECEBCF4
MSKPILPDLTFPTVEYGKLQTPLNLRPLLYFGGASIHADQVNDLLDRGQLGSPIVERLELVKKLHDEINGDLVGGGAASTVRTRITALRLFFTWAEKNKQKLNLDTVEDSFKLWTDHLLERRRVIGDVLQRSIKSVASSVGRLLDKVFQRRIKLLSETRLRGPRFEKVACTPQIDKQNLTDTFRFGYFLLDVCDGLAVESIWAPLPVKIALRTGKVLELWSGLVAIEKLVRGRDRHTISRTLNARDAWSADFSFRTRSPIVNLRIEAELLVFISQTGMNLAQAHSARNGQFHYTSHLDGYQVRRYKERRHGEVVFDIHSEYRTIFERYLAWRNTMFPDDLDGQLFPLLRTKGRSESTPPKFYGLKVVCKKLNVPFFRPRALRNTRVNWLLRQSQDPALTAEMAQHTSETLLQTYQKPNLQIAMIEIARFHNRTDPSISPPGPGWCVSPTPLPLENSPKNATQPDCVSAAGCLFCNHQRDIDSEDHVWSLASFRHLKVVELANHRPPDVIEESQSQPAAAAVDRLTSKLKFFETSSEIRGLWVREALARVTEEDYHPNWDGFIQLQDMRT